MSGIVRADSLNISKNSGPVLVIGTDGKIVSNSPSAAVLVAMWQCGHSEFHSGVERARASGQVVDVRLTSALEFFPDQKIPAQCAALIAPGTRIWAAVVPYGDEMLVVAKDTTLPDQMTEALLKSRMLLKSLLEQGVDIAFDLDPYGRFSFVTPPSAFGIRVEDWAGLPAQHFFWSDGVLPYRSPLDAPQKIDLTPPLPPQTARFESVKVMLPNEKDYFLDFDMEYLRDEEGMLTAIRGTCRNVSNRVEAVKNASLLGLRLSVQNRVTDILNKADNADELMDKASKTVRDILRADSVWMLVDYGRGLIPTAVEGESLSGVDLDDVWRAAHEGGQNSACDSGADIHASSGGFAGKGLKTYPVDGQDLLMIVLAPSGQHKGIMLVSRQTDVNPWSAQELDLMEAIGDMLTATLGKAMMFDRLQKLSNSDVLTNSLNRRAFMEAVDRRLHYQERTQLTGALIFIDLDYFKEVNDNLGHKAGDQVLQKMVDGINKMIRPCDYVGRYGGDEFIIWLEDVDSQIAMDKAQSFLALVLKVKEELHVEFGTNDTRLSASIGVAMSIPGAGDSFDSLAQLADKVLYDVKQFGKHGVKLAERD